jgi:hypothetical protein
MTEWTRPEWAEIKDMSGKPRPTVFWESAMYGTYHSEQRASRPTKRDRKAKKRLAKLAKRARGGKYLIA